MVGCSCKWTDEVAHADLTPGPLPRCSVPEPNGVAKALKPRASSAASAASRCSETEAQHEVVSVTLSEAADAAIGPPIDTYQCITILDTSNDLDTNGGPVSRVQLALNVSDLDEAITFYSKLFGAEPAKVRPGYANFAIADPR